MSKNPRICVLPIGPFGRAVARHLQALDATPVDVVNHVATAAASGAAAVVVAAWRPVPALCSLLDLKCRESGKTCVPVVLDGSTIQVGPVTARSPGGCWLCWARRLKQHDHDDGRRAALWHYYDRNSDAGPHGFVEALAAIGGAQAMACVRATLRGDATAGRIWRLDIVSREVTQSIVIGVHGCERCGLRVPPATRGHRELRAALSFLWCGAEHRNETATPLKVT